MVQTWSNWIKMDQIGLNLDFGKFGQKLSQTGSNLINFVQTCFYSDFWQFGQLGLWVTWALGDLSFGWLELWVTWALMIWEIWTFDSLGDLDIGQFGYLQLWETCVLYLLGNLCIVNFDSRFGGWKYFQSCL